MVKAFAMLGFLFALLASSTAMAAPVNIYVSILPEKYFAEKIGGDRVHVSVMVLPGASPATYEPKPKQMADLSETTAYLAIGVPFEKTWLPKIASANPRMKIFHVDAGIKKRMMERHRHDEEKAGDQGGDQDHSGGEPDPHVWTAPPEVRIIAGNIRTALERIDPDGNQVYQANYESFIKEIDELDNELKKTFGELKNRAFMVFHPSWGYFARAYDLTQIPVEIEGKEPKPAQLKELIDEAKKQGILVIFVQPQFSVRSAGLIARAIGGQVMPADPLAESWAENLRKQSAVFRDVMRQEQTGDKSGN